MSLAEFLLYSHRENTGVPMNEREKNTITSFTSFDQMEGHASTPGMNDWAVPWSDLMMVMFVLFVVLFVYSETHQNVKVLFSQQSADEAQATSTLDPLIGLIGQISSRAGGQDKQESVNVTGSEVLYRSRIDGVTVVREGRDRIKVTLRGELFFAAGESTLKPDADQYLQEVARVVKLSVGTVHVVGYAAANEASGTRSFILSSQRATDVADYLMGKFAIAPKRIIVSGRGTYNPEVPETSEANHTMNRRVEIIITNEV